MNAHPMTRTRRRLRVTALLAGSLWVTSLALAQPVWVTLSPVDQRVVDVAAQARTCFVIQGWIVDDPVIPLLDVDRPEVINPPPTVATQVLCVAETPQQLIRQLRR